MRIESPPTEFANLKGADIHNYGHLPAAAAYCRRLELVDMVNAMVPSQIYSAHRKARVLHGGTAKTIDQT